MTPFEYDELLNKQDGRCAICLGTDNNGKRFDVDHDHATGLIRGLLCRLCNQALGMFKDDVKNLDRAIQYLNQHEVNNITFMSNDMI